MPRIVHPRRARVQTITVQGRFVKAWPLLSKGRYPYLLYDHSGMLYEVSWDAHGKGFTPHQRSHARYTQADIVYVTHEQGLIAYQRKLKHVMRHGTMRMFYLEELETLAHEVNATFTTLNRADPQPQLKHIDTLVDRIISGIDRATSDGLREAQEQLSYVMMFVDSRGRFNIGVLMCHTATAYERLRERLENIQLWQNVFAQRLLATEQLIDEFFRAVRKLIGRIESHQMQLTAGESSSWGLLNSQLKQYIQYFERWQYLKPFDAWIRHTLADLNELRVVVRREDTVATLALLKKLHHAARLKLISQELFAAIMLLSAAELEVGTRNIYPAAIADEARKHLIVASNHMKQISDAGFRFRVRDKVLTNLRQVIRQIGKPFNGQMHPREMLKQTAALL